MKVAPEPTQDANAQDAPVLTQQPVSSPDSSTINPDSPPSGSTDFFSHLSATATGLTNTVVSQVQTGVNTGAAITNQGLQSLGQHTIGKDNVDLINSMAVHAGTGMLHAATTGAGEHGCCQCKVGKNVLWFNSCEVCIRIPKALARQMGLID